jgi:hypothetical protein
VPLIIGYVSVIQQPVSLIVLKTGPDNDGNVLQRYVPMHK